MMMMVIKHSRGCLRVAKIHCTASVVKELWTALSNMIGFLFSSFFQRFALEKGHCGLYKALTIEEKINRKAKRRRG